MIAMHKMDGNTFLSENLSFFASLSLRGQCDLSLILTEEFGLSKPNLFSNYKVMLLLCHLRVKLNSKSDS